MEDTPSGDGLKPRLTALFYSTAATVFDALILCFALVLSGGHIGAEGIFMIIMCVGLLFPCVGD